MGGAEALKGLELADDEQVAGAAAQGPAIPGDCNSAPQDRSGHASHHLVAAGQEG